MKARRGFTLIELLVVIAIIAILAAILFPVFARARSAARAISCLSGAKQLGTGLVMYVQDYDEKFPNWNWNFFCNNGNNGAPRDSASFWTTAILPYVKNQQIYQCSEDILSWDDAYDNACSDDNGKNDKFGPWGLDGKQCDFWAGCNPNYVSFALNESLTGGNSYNKLAAIPNASSVMMIGDASPQLANMWPDPNNTTRIIARMAFSAQSSGCCMMWEDWGTPNDWLNHYTQSQLDGAARHHGGSNVTYADSHSKFQQWTKLTQGNLTGVNNN